MIRLQDFLLDLRAARAQANESPTTENLEALKLAGRTLRDEVVATLATGQAVVFYSDKFPSDAVVTAVQVLYNFCNLQYTDAQGRVLSVDMEQATYVRPATMFRMTMFATGRGKYEVVCVNNRAVVKGDFAGTLLSFYDERGQPLGLPSMSILKDRVELDFTEKKV